MERRQERDRDSSRKEHSTKLITPQVAKLEHTYRPGTCTQTHLQTRYLNTDTPTDQVPEHRHTYRPSTHTQTPPAQEPANRNPHTPRT